MQTIKRKVETKKKEDSRIVRFGYSSLGTFSIMLEKDKNENEELINLDKDELAKLINFLHKFKWFNN